jgi:hypothetical protein
MELIGPKAMTFPSRKNALKPDQVHSPDMIRNVTNQCTEARKAVSRRKPCGYEASADQNASHITCYTNPPRH